MAINGGSVAAMRFRTHASRENSWSWRDITSWVHLAEPERATSLLPKECLHFVHKLRERALQGFPDDPIVGNLT
jgi:hypothetical protein